MQEIKGLKKFYILHYQEDFPENKKINFVYAFTLEQAKEKIKVLYKFFTGELRIRKATFSDLYLSYLNDFLTVESFQEYYQLTNQELKKVLSCREKAQI